MKQGTISVFIGCHSPIHSYYVFKSWKKLYGEYPTFKETVCILLHDIGHVGLNYLSDENAKKKHWILGAKIAGKLFGVEYFTLTAGHCEYSSYYQGGARNKLYFADKYSWHIAPYWWLYLNNIVEPELKQGMSSHEAIIEFKEKVKQSVESGEYKSTHKIYMERCKNGNSK